MKNKITIKNTEIYLNKSDGVVSGSLSLGIYENKVFNNIYKEIKHDDTFVDVGANIGLYCCSIAKKLGPRGKVFGIEPAPLNFKYLSKNKITNKLSNLTILDKAVSSEPGFTQLHLNELNHGDHRINYNENDRRFIKIEKISIDKLVELYSIKNLDVIKIDVQGADFDVLIGMKETIKKNPKIRIFIEFWPWGIRKFKKNPFDMLDFIKEYKFSIFNAETNQLIPETDIHMCVKKNLERLHFNFLLKRNL